MRSLCLDVRPSFNDQFSQFWEQCTANVRPLATFLFLAKFEYVNKLEKKYLSNPCFITSTRLPQALEFNQFKTDLPTSNPSLLASNALDPNDSVWFLNQPSQLCPLHVHPKDLCQGSRFSFSVPHTWRSFTGTSTSHHAGQIILHGGIQSSVLLQRSGTGSTGSSSVPKQPDPGTI